MSSVPWGTFLRTPSVWAINVAHFSFNFGYYTLMAWLPSYFELALGLNVENSSLLTLIPYLAMMAMTPFVSALSLLNLHGGLQVLLTGADYATQWTKS